jgi:hypothetical protein
LCSCEIYGWSFYGDANTGVPHEIRIIPGEVSGGKCERIALLVDSKTIDIRFLNGEEIVVRENPSPDIRACAEPVIGEDFNIKAFAKTREKRAAGLVAAKSH